MSFFKQTWMQKNVAFPQILVGIGGGGGLPVIGIDNVARENAEQAIEAVETLTAQVGDIVNDQQGVLSSDGILYVNNTGAAITLTGSTNLTLAADGLVANGGVLTDGSISNSKLTIMPANTIKGNLQGSSSQPQDLDPIGIATILPSATSNTKGVMDPLDKRKVDATEYVFANVADMLLSTDLEEGNVIKTLGYFSYADGGSNRYVVVPAGTQTDDGGSFIDLPAVGLQAQALFIEGEVRIEQWGISKGGTFDCGPAFQAAIDWCNANGVAKLIGAATEFEDYGIGQQIIMREDVYLDLKGQTVYPLTDGAGFLLARKSGIRDFIFEASQRPSWTGPLFLLNDYTDSNILNFPRVEFVRCNCFNVQNNGSPNGTMFRFDGRPGVRITGVRATQLIAQNMAVVCEFFPSETSTSGWINSNLVHFDMIYNCKEVFKMNRESNWGAFTNNVIEATVQPGPTPPGVVVSCDGESNLFDLTIWDWVADEHPICLQFGEISTRNIVKGAFTPLAIQDLSDPSSRNTFESRTNRVGTFTSNGVEPTSRGSGIFGGQVDNCLAYAHLRYSVSSLPVTTGSINNVFVPNAGGKAFWNDVENLEIVVDLGSNRGPLRTIGVVFAHSEIPETVSFEKSLDGVSWTEFDTLVASRVTTIMDKNVIPGTFRYLRIRCNTTGPSDIGIFSIFALWSGDPVGAYMPIGGGEFFGDILINRGRNISFGSVSGGGEASISVDNSDRLSVSATGGLKINGTRVLGDQQPSVDDPTGGSNVDSECRSALIDLLDRIRNHGLISI